jgi:hypothetical protein
MRNLKYILLFLCLFSGKILLAQTENFIVKRTSFSSRIADEFSPVYYKDGLVFCSTSGNNSIIGYSENQKGLVKIFYVKKTAAGWKQPGILSGELTTFFNDGPVTFNATGNIAYFSRNSRVENVIGNVNDSTNKLGIFSAEFIDGKWANIVPFAFNDARFNFSTPALADGGNRLYFSSDKPGGFGGMDLYYTDKSEGRWKEPVNLGPLVNTANNELFPFASTDGKVFFSSDGHPGFGGKDIYYTRQKGDIWINPEHLDSAINSVADDFGLITDSTFEQGYFSSNRLKTDDIFSFRVLEPQFSHCDTIKENNYCFTFYDERQQFIDTVAAIYNWDFGDGKIRKGKEVKYCFPGEGEYTVRLSIIDAIGGKAIADKVEYRVSLKDIEQALINSDNIGLVNQPVTFEGIASGLAGFSAKACFWNFGDGFRPGRFLETKTFGKKGNYTVQLGLWGQKDSLGIIPEKCYLKNIRIFNSFEEIKLPGEKTGSIHYRLFLMDDLSEKQRQNIKKLLASPGEPVIEMNEGRFAETEDAMLRKIAGILQANQDISLETGTFMPEDIQGKAPGTNLVSREMACYFKSKGINENSFRCSAGNILAPGAEISQADNKSGEITVELIFMKNQGSLHD